MEVVIPVQNMDFDFNRAGSSPYLTAPSTPKGFGQFYFSAPTSPTHFSGFNRDFDNFLIINRRPESPKGRQSARDFYHSENDFAFDVSEEMEFNSLSAEELFDGGQIRPIKPPPIQKGPDPFGSVSENTRKIKTEENRGRERNSSLSSSNSGRRETRSLSPLRVSEYPWEEDTQLQNNPKQQSSTSSKSSGLSSSGSKGSRKWRLRDFFLFRSASEGRATDLKKYRDVDVKSSSFRVIDRVGSGSRRRGPVSAHELHYTMNRAVSEDLKKKTFLPYKQGILGRLAFNPAVHAIANGFGFSRRR